jgi:hypothetical protein
MVAQFGSLVGRSTCPGLLRVTKVPRRGTRSLAVGETHGLPIFALMGVFCIEKPVRFELKPVRFGILEKLSR